MAIYFKMQFLFAILTKILFVSSQWKLWNQTKQQWPRYAVFDVTSILLSVNYSHKLKKMPLLFAYKISRRCFRRLFVWWFCSKRRRDHHHQGHLHSAPLSGTQPLQGNPPLRCVISFYLWLCVLLYHKIRHSSVYLICTFLVFLQSLCETGDAARRCNMSKWHHNSYQIKRMYACFHLRESMIKTGLLFSFCFCNHWSKWGDDWFWSDLPPSVRRFEVLILNYLKLLINICQYSLQFYAKRHSNHFALHPAQNPTPTSKCLGKEVFCPEPRSTSVQPWAYCIACWDEVFYTCCQNHRVQF